MQNHLIPLTVKRKSFNLNPLSQKTKVGIRTPRNGDRTPITLSVFLCPQYSNNTGLIRVLSSMVDCLRGRKPARTVTGSSNLIQSTARCFEPNGGGYSLHNGVTAMSHDKTALPTETRPVLYFTAIYQDKYQRIAAYSAETAKQRALELLGGLSDFYQTFPHDVDYSDYPEIQALKIAALGVI